MEKFCRNCGSRLNDSDGICPKCGFRSQGRSKSEDKVISTTSSHKESRKRRNMGILLVVAVACLLCAVYTLLNFDVVKNTVLSPLTDLFNLEDKSELARVYEGYAEQWEVISDHEDGTYTISITAPDIVTMIKEATAQDNAGQFDEDALLKLVEEQTVGGKEFTFVTDSKNQEDIQDLFLDKVAYDLWVSAILELDMNELGDL